MEEEKFYEIPGHPKYVISKSGVVKHVRKNKIKSPQYQGKYLYISLHIKNARSQNIGLHRLLMLTFVPNPNNYPEINHIDGNKFNNSLDNLEWCDRRRNIDHAMEHGLTRKGETHGMHKLTEDEVRKIRELRGTISIRNIASLFNVSRSAIDAIFYGHNWAWLK